MIPEEQCPQEDDLRELARTISRLVKQEVSQPRRPRSTTQTIVDFDAFILANVPYGKITVDNVSQGLIEFDGPIAPGAQARPQLQWYFGGRPYPIDLAIRIQYIYPSTYASDMAGQSEVASLFIGYKLQRGFAPKYNKQADGNINTIKKLVDMLDEAIRVMASDTDPIPSSAETIRDFDSFIYDNWPDLEHDPFIVKRKPKYLIDRAEAANGKRPRRKRDELPPEPLLDMQIEYDGPARDYNSNNVYPYSRNEVFTVPDRYSLLLQWFFGGRHYPITKAIRIVLDGEGVDERALFIGYQGPGGH